MSSFTADSVSDTSANSTTTSAFQETLLTGKPKAQLEAIAALVEQGDRGEDALLDVLLEWQDEPVTPIAGKLYQILLQSERSAIQSQLLAHFPEGLVELTSEAGIDYEPIQTLLAQQDYEAADRVTLQKLCELAGPAAVKRKWIYFTEVGQFPVTDLQTIDCLWQVYSEGKFGFSVQRNLWLGVKRDWDKLWPKIDWKTGNQWTRYPTGFTWDLTAPPGHLPLSNQLRGVRVMAELLNHPAWTTAADG